MPSTGRTDFVLCTVNWGPEIGGCIRQMAVKESWSLGRISQSAAQPGLLYAFPSQ
jgi:hypothetical protein